MSASALPVYQKPMFVVMLCSCNISKAFPLLLEPHEGLQSLKTSVETSHVLCLYL